MYSKWIIDIKGLENFRFGEDKKLYRLPYTKGKRSYCVREIKIQYPSRWILNGIPYSKKQLKNKIIIDYNPIKLLITDTDLPF